MSVNLKALSANRDAVARTYWKSRLAGFEGTACFEDQSIGLEGNGHTVYTIKASEETASQLNTIAGSDKAAHIILMCTVGVLAHKLSAATDVVIFTPVYEEGTEPNEIPIRVQLHPGQNFREMVLHIKEQLLRDLGHGGYPLEKILDTAATPFTEVPLTGMQLGDLQWNNLGPDLLFSFNRQDGLTLHLEYDSSKFSALYISSLAGSCLYLLQQLMIHREKPISAFEVITPEDAEYISRFNNTEVPYPHNATIISLFEEQVRKTPGNIAVRGFGGELTYGALNELSGRIAVYLRDQAGVKPGDLVGLMLERESSLMPAVFGILKAGGVYVPIDPHFPPARIQAITNDSGLKVIITREKFIPQLEETSLQIIDLDKLMDIIISLPHALPLADVHSSQLAYVIYTSGSTGKPKGVMITHTAVVNRLVWMQKKFPVSETDVLMQKTPLVFDVSVWELFWWSFTGGSLCMLKPGGEKDPAEIMSVVQEHQVTTIHFVPSMLKAFLSWLEKHPGRYHQSSLRQVFASGEALKPEYVRQFKNTMQARLINLYGPTEATVDVSCYECDFTQEITAVPIGWPIDNIRLYIMSPALQLLPVGIPGELYIAGIGLAKGYLNNEVLTTQKFIEKHERMYKTGDRAKLQDDGNIAYLGREDEQLKIRGYRIEPGEIENRLCEHPAINDAVVVAKDGKEGMLLIAYYVSEQALETAALRNFLGYRLPDYMLPSWFVQLKSIPLTPNGKLNRKALPDPQISITVDYKAPSGETENRLLEIWAVVLEMDKKKISTTGNFFELGGNSLRLMQLNLMVNESLGTGISIPEMFSYPTIRTLAKFISAATTGREGYKEEAKSEVGSMHNLIDILNKF